MNAKGLSIVCGLLAGLAAAVMPRRSFAQTASEDTLCHGRDATLEQRAEACSAVIAAGKADKRALADAYAQRGFVYTFTRKLELAQQDLDKAIETDPGYARGYINRANFWNVAHRPDRALATRKRPFAWRPTRRSPTSCAPARTSSSANTTGPSPTTTGRSP